MLFDSKKYYRLQETFQNAFNPNYNIMSITTTRKKQPAEKLSLLSLHNSVIHERRRIDQFSSELERLHYDIDDLKEERNEAKYSRLRYQEKKNIFMWGMVAGCIYYLVLTKLARFGKPAF